MDRSPFGYGNPRSARCFGLKSFVLALRLFTGSEAYAGRKNSIAAWTRYTCCSGHLRGKPYTLGEYPYPVLSLRASISAAIFCVLKLDFLITEGAASRFPAPDVLVVAVDITDLTKA